MSSLRLPLLSELIFPLALRAAEKPALGFSWETAVKRAKWANISLFIHTCEQTRRQTGKQTHVRSNTIGKVRGSALPDTHGASLPENPFLLWLSLRLTSTPSFAQQLIRVTRACVGLADVCVTVCAYQVRVWVGVFFECLFLRNPRVWLAHFRSGHLWRRYKHVFQIGQGRVCLSVEETPMKNRRTPLWLCRTQR